VLVPGFTQTAASWRGVRRILEESCEVVTLDVPERDTFASTAISLGGQGGRGVYVGYSMGGRLALHVALERVAEDEARAVAVERDGVDAFLDAWLAQPLFASVPPDAPGLAERRGLSERYLAHCLRVLGTGAMEPMWDRLAELEMPIALVTGKTDAKFEKIALTMLERFRGEVVHVRLDGGHAVPLEQPAVLGGFIASFASRHG